MNTVGVNHLCSITDAELRILELQDASTVGMQNHDLPEVDYAAALAIFKSCTGKVTPGSVRASAILHACRINTPASMRHPLQAEGRKRAATISFQKDSEGQSA